MAMGQQDPSPLPHAVYQFHRRGRFCGDSGYAPSPAYPRRNDECGHAARLCAGQRRSVGSAADAPGVNRPFKTPLVPLVPILAIGFSGLLIVSLSYWTQLRLVVWLVIGLVIYFTYGVTHSKVRNAVKPSLSEVRASAPHSTDF